MINLVLIPGLISDKYVWQALADAAPKTYKIHHADLTHSDNITEMARAIVTELDGMIVVVGHSLGGRVAMEIARIAPARVTALILANTGHHPKKHGEEIKRQKMIDLGHESMENLANQWLPPMLNPEATPDPHLVSELKAMVLRADADIHERQIRALIKRPDASQYLSQILCPTLLLVGRQDGWSPIAQHQEIADGIPNSELTIIENAGHFAPVEQVEDVVNSILNWLSKT